MGHDWRLNPKEVSPIRIYLRQRLFKETHESQDAVDPLDTRIFLNAGARKDGASVGPREVFKKK
jgi:hypothetical protein